MICFVDIEHESWLQDPAARVEHFDFCMDVKLKLEEISGRPCLVQRYSDLTQQGLQELGVSALVISGNATDWIQYAPEELEELTNVIRSEVWPILGLCGGLQLIAMAHGATVAPMRRLRPGEPDLYASEATGFFKERGFMVVDVIKGDPILDGLGASPVFLEVHYCEVKELPSGFEVLASSKECRVQVMKQLERPIYGVQFHPEGYTEWPNDRRNALVKFVYPRGYEQAQLDGRGLLTNFFRLAGVLT